MSQFPPDDEYEKGYVEYFNPRTERKMLYIGLFHEETESQRGEIALSWPLAVELGPTMTVKPHGYQLFTEIPELFEALSSTFPSNVKRHQITDWLRANGYRNFTGE